MLDYYLGKEELLGGGVLTIFVNSIQGFAFEGDSQNPSFRLETVIFGGILGSLYALLQFFFAPIWGRISDRIGRRPVLLTTLFGTCIGYGLWIFAGHFWILVFSRILSGVASGNLSVATAAIADVTSRETRSKGMAFVGVAFGLGFVVGPALGGFASQWSWDENTSGMFQMTPFSLAALISFCLAVINIIWLACAFKETLPEHKRNTDKKSKPVIFELGRIKNLAVRNTCLAYLFYMVSFSGMEFTLTFLAVERFAYEPLQIMKMFLLIGGTLIFAQGYLVRKFVGKIGEKTMAISGIFIGILAFGMIALIKDESWFLYRYFSCQLVWLLLAQPSLLSPLFTQVKKRKVFILESLDLQVP